MTPRKSVALTSGIHVIRLTGKGIGILLSKGLIFDCTTLKSFIGPMMTALKIFDKNKGIVQIFPY